MQGLIPNIMEGFSSNVVSGANTDLSCDINEMCFWMWRVKAIAIAINITLNPPPPEEGQPDSDPQIIAFSGAFGCPINGTGGPIRNEQDQLVRRVGFRNSSDGIKGEGNDPSITFTARFCEAALHIPGFAMESGWFLTAGFEARFPAGNLNSERGSSVSAPIAMQITGEDPILGGTYNHLVPIWVRSIVEGWTFTGGITIIPIQYYPWRNFDTGVALFNEGTGLYA